MKKKISIGYLGPSGTYSSQAADLVGKYFYDQNFILAGMSTISDVLWEIQKGSIDLGVVPVENSIEGTINVTMDVLTHEVDLQIIAEVVLDIDHCLLSKESDLSNITKILSHNHALAQCRKTLKKMFPDAELVSTASSIEAVKSTLKDEKGLAALASRKAAVEYNLPIIAENICDYSGNKTRFWVIGKELHHKTTGKHKTSIVMALEENKPGGLYSVLRYFAEHNINLTKIESRPAKRELGDYLFYIDCEGSMADEVFKKVIEKLDEETVFLKILGSYQELADRV